MQLLEYQERALKTLTNKIEEFDNILIYGKKGVGKTHTFKKLLEKPTRNQFIFNKILYVAFEADNQYEIGIDFLIKELSLYSNYGEKLISTNNVTKIFPKPLSRVVDIFIELNSPIKKILRNYGNIFNDKEINILIELINLNSHCNVLLIFDGIENANNETLDFIEKISKKEISSKLFDKTFKIISITNSNKFFKIEFDFKFEMFISNKDYEEFLNNLGIEDSYLIEMYTNITSKNLEQTLSIISILNEANISINEVDFSDSNDIFEKLKEQIEKIFKSQKMLEQDYNIIKFASIIGLVFKHNDLKLLSNYDYDVISSSLNKWKKNKFIFEYKSNDSQYYDYRFLYKMIREYILSIVNEKDKYHYEYAKIIKKNSPTQHILLAQRYLEAHKMKEAEEEYIIQFIKERVTNNNYNSLIDNEKKYIQNHNFFEELKEILELYKNRDFCKCIEKISITSSITNKFYQATMNYIKAMSMISYCTKKSNFIESIDLLKNSLTYFRNHDYIDMVIDLGNVMINVYSYKLSNIQKAKEIHEEIELFCLEKGINEDLESSFCNFNRRAASILEPRLAYEKLKNLLARSESHLDIIDSYKLYNDLTAYSLYNGDFNNAQNYCDILNRIIIDMDDNFFPEIYKPQNNRALVNIFLNVNDRDLFEKQVKNALSVLKNYINVLNITNVVKLNYYTLMIIIGDLDEGIQQLLNLKECLEQYDNALYTTFINTNISSGYLIKGEYDEAYKYCEIVKNNIDKWNEIFRIDFESQNNRLRELIINKVQVTPYELFTQFDTKIERSKFIHRGFLLSELLFYMT